MPGINRYKLPEIQAQYRNLHEAFEKRASVNFSMATRKPSAPCIFLSHRSTDKEAVRKIGEYIMAQGIDVYLDADDPNLQKADRDNDHQAITTAIELGITNSTDLLAYVTPNTVASPWVPYEIGFAKRDGSQLAAMKSKDLTALPSYLVIVHQITGIESLKDYLQKIIKRDATPGQQVVKLSRILDMKIEDAGLSHPLSRYLAQR